MEQYFALLVIISYDCCIASLANMQAGSNDAMISASAVANDFNVFRRFACWCWASSVVSLTSMSFAGRLLQRGEVVGVGWRFP